MVEEVSIKVEQPPAKPTTKILIGEVSAINATVIKKFLEKYPLLFYACKRTEKNVSLARLYLELETN